MSKTEVDTPVSLGAGIAIFGVWAAGATVTIFIMLIMFVWSPQREVDASEVSVLAVLILILLIALPLITAFAATKTILNRDD